MRAARRQSEHVPFRLLWVSLSLTALDPTPMLYLGTFQGAAAKAGPGETRLSKMQSRRGGWSRRLLPGSSNKEMAEPAADVKGMILEMKFNEADLRLSLGIQVGERAPVLLMNQSLLYMV